jgi:hypothetical protein
LQYLSLSISLDSIFSFRVCKIFICVHRPFIRVLRVHLRCLLILHLPMESLVTRFSCNCYGIS